MTTLSTALVTPAGASESIPFLTVEASAPSAAHAAIIKSRLEPSKVLHVAFGEWPVPKVDHPDSMGIREFVQGLEDAGHSALLSEGRRALSEWFDKKPTLRTLRLAAGLSQDQLAILMGTSQPQIARVESGRQDLQLKTLKRLAEVLNVSIHDVVDAASG